MPSRPPTRIMDVIDFIDGPATTAEVLAICCALEARQERDFATRVAAAKIGCAVTVQDASPDYLDGLTGTIVAVDGDVAAIELDELSAGFLRFHAQAREDGFSVWGKHPKVMVPTQCCVTEANYVLAATP